MSDNRTLIERLRELCELWINPKAGHKLDAERLSAFGAFDFPAMLAEMERLTAREQQHQERCEAALEVIESITQQNAKLRELVKDAYRGGMADGLAGRNHSAWDGSFIKQRLEALWTR